MITSTTPALRLPLHRAGLGPVFCSPYPSSCCFCQRTQCTFQRKIVPPPPTVHSTMGDSQTPWHCLLVNSSGSQAIPSHFTPSQALECPAVGAWHFNAPQWGHGTSMHHSGGMALHHVRGPGPGPHPWLSGGAAVCAGPSYPLAIVPLGITYR